MPAYTPCVELLGVLKQVRLAVFSYFVWACMGEMWVTMRPNPTVQRTQVPPQCLCYIQSYEAAELGLLILASCASDRE